MAVHRLFSFPEPQDTHRLPFAKRRTLTRRTLRCPASHCQSRVSTHRETQENAWMIDKEPKVYEWSTGSCAVWRFPFTQAARKAGRYQRGGQPTPSVKHMHGANPSIPSAQAHMSSCLPTGSSLPARCGIVDLDAPRTLQRPNHARSVSGPAVTGLHKEKNSMVMTRLDNLREANKLQIKKLVLLC